MTREQAILHAVEAYDSGVLQDTLARRIAYPTESEVSTPAPAQHAYLSIELVPRLSALGFSCEVHPNPAGVDLHRGRRQHRILPRSPRLALE